MSQLQWNSRIIGEPELVSVDDLTEQESNVVNHTAPQLAAIRKLLDQVAIVSPIRVNKNTMNVVDGHMRLAFAREEGEEEILVSYLDLTIEEEAVILAALDPIGERSRWNYDNLAELAEFQSDAEENRKQVLAKLNERVWKADEIYDILGIEAPEDRKISACIFLQRTCLLR